MITFVMEGMIEPSVISHGVIVAIAIISAVITLTFYALRSIGLFVLARRQKVKCAFLAFIPYAWLYLACKIIGNLRTFGSTFAKLAWVFALIFAVSEILTLVYNILVYYPLIGNLLIGGKEVYYVLDSVEQFLAEYPGYVIYWPGESFVYQNGAFVWPYSLKAEAIILKVTDVISLVSIVFNIASIVITVNVYIALFRKFWPQHYVLATLLSAFLGLFAPFVFAIRKKDPIKYSEYLRQKYNAYYGPYGPYGNPYGRPPYGANPNPNTPRPPEHPFTEFAERGEVDPGDPFTEFSDKNKEPFSEYDKKDKE